MSKKRDKRSSSTHAQTPTKGHETHLHESNSIEHAILKNFVDLQKIHADLAEKFDKLAKEISELLKLFETTAKTFTKNIPLGEYEKDKEFLEKIDKLLEQNKVLAKGLTLMEEHLRERVYGLPSSGREESISQNRPLPRF